MDSEQAVIYVARTPQQAHLLRNLLDESGIRAQVHNSVLEGGAGVDIVGWPTMARVVVERGDAITARRMAVEFDMAAAVDPSSRQWIETEQDNVYQEPRPWPECPDCSAPRLTVCPICGTAGTDFPQADHDLGEPLHAGDLARNKATGCGSAGCSSCPPSETGDDADDAAAMSEDEDDPGGLLICPTCDEPFRPAYPRLCPWCDHEFADGFDVTIRPAPETAEQLTPRVVIVLLALAGLAAALVGYFFVVAR